MRTKTPPRSIDSFLATVSPDKRAALVKLRKAIRAVVPKAEEGITYGLPAFRLDGQWLVAFGAGVNHCAFYPMSGSTVAAHAKDLSGYETSKGAIRFPASEPMPAALVRQLVLARIAENRRRADAKKARASRTDPAVDAFMRALKHPLKKDLEAVRRMILGIDPSIRECIKWNAPTFRASDDFATLFLRSRDRVQLIFHTGAKAKAAAKTGLAIADPKNLVKWLAKDRCIVTLGAGREIQANRAPFTAIVKAWIRQL